MPTAVTIHETARRLAEAETPVEEAVRELLDCCGDKRVAVVLARQQLFKLLQASPGDPIVTRAADLLDRVLDHLPMA